MRANPRSIDYVLAIAFLLCVPVIAAGIIRLINIGYIVLPWSK
jgi:hypothetical protein